MMELRQGRPWYEMHNLVTTQSSARIFLLSTFYYAMWDHSLFKCHSY